MTPLPKRKHSTQRRGKRKASLIARLSKLVVCASCGKKKRSHRLCKYCGK